MRATERDLAGRWPPSDHRATGPKGLGRPFGTFRAQAVCDNRELAGGLGPAPPKRPQGPLGDDVLARINDHAIHRLSQLFATELGERVGAS
jgi:hypothetical protein